MFLHENMIYETTTTTQHVHDMTMTHDTRPLYDLFFIPLI
jgi:hypothetical protein